MNSRHLNFIFGCRQVVRHQTLTLTVRGFESYHPSQKERPSQKMVFLFGSNERIRTHDKTTSKAKLDWGSHFEGILGAKRRVPYHPSQNQEKGTISMFIITLVSKIPVFIFCYYIGYMFFFPRTL